MRMVVPACRLPAMLLWGYSGQHKDVRVVSEELAQQLRRVLGVSGSPAITGPTRRGIRPAIGEPAKLYHIHESLIMSRAMPCHSSQQASKPASQQVTSRMTSSRMNGMLWWRVLSRCGLLLAATAGGGC